MVQQQSVQRTKIGTSIGALLICALSFCGIQAQELSAQVSTHEHGAHPNVTLHWDSKKVHEYREQLPLYLRNRKIKHYAMAAAIIGGTAAYTAWYIYQSPTDAPSNTKPAPNAVILSLEERVRALEHIRKVQESFFLWSAPQQWIGGLSIPYLNIGPAIKSIILGLIGNEAVNRARNIFTFREDIVWFYHEEKSIPLAARHLEATAHDFDLARAAKTPDPVIIDLKKQMLLDSAHHYLDCLMSLYAFAEHRSQYLLSKLEKITLRDALIQHDMLSKGSMPASIMQNGIDLPEKLNRILEQTVNGQQPAETARSVVTQTNNLIQAVVAAYMRCEKYA